MNLKQALKQLDSGDDAHWTADGLPRIDYLATLVGNPNLKRGDITNADPSLVRLPDEDVKDEGGRQGRGPHRRGNSSFQGSAEGGTGENRSGGSSAVCGGGTSQERASGVERIVRQIPGCPSAASGQRPRAFSHSALHGLQEEDSGGEGKTAFKKRWTEWMWTTCLIVFRGGASKLDHTLAQRNRPDGGVTP